MNGFVRGMRCGLCAHDPEECCFICSRGFIQCCMNADERLSVSSRNSVKQRNRNDCL
jgi:hypothetical protein